MEVTRDIRLMHSKCTGCAGCLNKCPVDAIEMRADYEGFLYPEIRKNRCIECGKCIDVCPVNEQILKEDIQSEPMCYAAWSRNEEIRFHSTSGGVFTHLANAVLENGGVVVGAKYREDILVEHTMIYGKEEVEALRQSKYVQSEVGYVLREVEKELKQGRMVLYVGTPCQCAGVKAYLEDVYNNLFLCDFVCLGVNSPMAYLAYLKELEECYKSKVKKVWFKNKSNGWNRFATKIVFENGEEYIADRENDSFMLGYIKRGKGLYMRMCCYNCEFKGIQRPVDFTLGDFWGIEKAFPEADSANGISLVMIQSEKGKKLWELCKEQLHCHQMQVKDAIPGNPRMLSSAELSDDRTTFFDNLRRKGFEKSVKKHEGEVG